MNSPIRLSLFEVLGLMRYTLDDDSGQSTVAADLAQSIDDDVADYNGSGSATDPDWCPRGYDSE